MEDRQKGVTRNSSIIYTKSAHYLIWVRYEPGTSHTSLAYGLVLGPTPEGGWSFVSLALLYRTALDS